MGNIDIGDIVRLKSGGPDMTVSKINEDGFTCIWFNKLETGSFIFQEAENIPYSALNKVVY